MTDNLNMGSVPGRPVSAQNFLQPGGPTTAELRYQANPQRPNWGDRSSSSNRDEITSLGSDAPLTGPNAGHIRDAISDPGDSDTLNGIDVDHQTHQAFSLYPSNMPGRMAGPAPVSPWDENPVPIDPNGHKIDRGNGNMMGAGWGRGRMSRKKKWIIAGIVGGSLVALAVGLGVYFGTKKPSSPPSPSSSPSPRPPISSSSSPPSPSQSAGPLVPGTYQVTMVKQSDPCANILDIVCVTPLYANWTFTSTDGKYDIAYNHNRDSVNVGAADSSGTLTFAFPAVTVTEANNCNYLNAMGVSLQLSTNSFSGAVVYGRTNPSACLDNRNYRIPQGAACNCEYTI